MARLIDIEPYDDCFIVLHKDDNGVPCKSIPTADVVEVKHGKWEVVDEAEPRRYGCSRCKCLSWTADNYCSYCGAKMDKEATDGKTGVDV